MGGIYLVFSGGINVVPALDYKTMTAKKFGKASPHIEAETAN
jgi:hypothetical protein